MAAVELSRPGLVPVPDRENDRKPNRGGTRGELPDPWQPPYIQECHAQSRVLVTWPKNDPQKRRYSTMCCHSWRHKGDCQKHRFCVDRDRIASALARYSPDDLIYLVCTYDPKEWDAGGFRPSRALDPMRRAQSNHRQITKMFVGLYDCWRKFYIGKGDGKRGFDGIREQMDCLGYVSTAEVMRRGWPHLNVVLVAPGLARRVREVTADLKKRMKTWKRWASWTPRERRSMLLSMVAQDIFPTLRETGFGRCSVEAVRDANKLAAYVAKLAMGEPVPGEAVQRDSDSNVISAEFAKMTQIPYEAPRHFRRLRSSSHFLPRVPGGDGTRSGCILSRSGELIAGPDFAERKAMLEAVAEQSKDEQLTGHRLAELAERFDAVSQGALQFAAELDDGTVYDTRTGEVIPDSVANPPPVLEPKPSAAVASTSLEAELCKRRGEPVLGSLDYREDLPGGRLDNIPQPPSAVVRDEFLMLIGAEAARRAAERFPDLTREREAWRIDAEMIGDELEWLASLSHPLHREDATPAGEIQERHGKHLAMGRYLDEHDSIQAAWASDERRSLWLRLRSPEERQGELDDLGVVLLEQLFAARAIRDHDVAARWSGLAQQTQAKIEALDNPPTPPTDEQRSALIEELRARASKKLHRQTYIMNSRRRPIDAAEQARLNLELAPARHIEALDPRSKWRAIVPREALEPERPPQSAIEGLL